MFDMKLTIINKWFNTATKKEEYVTSHINGSWSAARGISISGTQIIKSDATKCYILMSEKGYQKPEAFQATKKGWTLKPDDYIIKGKVTGINSIADIKQYESIKITNVSVKDYGSKGINHFEIEGS